MVSNTDFVVVATLIVSCYIAYRSKANSVTDIREQESYLNSRLKDLNYVEDKFVVKIDSIEVREDSSIPYRIKKALLLGPDGDTYVNVRWEHVGIKGGIWESDLGDIFYDSFDFEVEHITTEEVGDKVISKFKLGTIEPDDIHMFAGLLPQFVNKAYQETDGWEHEYSGSSFRLE